MSKRSAPSPEAHMDDTRPCRLSMASIRAPSATGSAGLAAPGSVASSSSQRKTTATPVSACVNHNTPRANPNQRWTALIIRSSQRFHDGVEEVVVHDRFGALRLRTRAPHHDDDLPTRIYVNELTENSPGTQRPIVIAAAPVRHRPPHVAVVGALSAHLPRRPAIAHPAFGKDAVTVDDSVIHHEQAESPIVAQGRTDSAPRYLESPRRLKPPTGVGLHSDFRPDLLAQVIANPAASGRTQ